MSTLTTEIPVLRPEAVEVKRARLVGGVVLATVLIAAYAPMLKFTAHVLVSSDDMAQGFVAPFVALYIGWSCRHKLFTSRAGGGPLGLTLVTVGAVLGLWSGLGGSMTLSRVAFLVSLTGCIELLFGRAAIRTLLFPLLLLLFTFPISQVLYGELTAPLQSLASKLSESVFDLIGVTALREGNIIHLPTQTLSIVDACSGLRSLLTLLFFTLTYVFFFERRLLLRIAFVALSVPAAILLNVARITTTGILAERVSPELTHGFPHEILGWSCFFLGVLVIVAIHQLVFHRHNWTASMREA